MRVLLAGEGRHELGRWAHEPVYRRPDDCPGVIEALLRRVFGEELVVVDAVCWKSIPKYRAGAHRSAEQRNVLGAAWFARERGCDALAFTRDRDGDRARGEEIARGLADVARMWPELGVVGGVAKEKIEDWILALAGHRGAEGHRHPDTVLTVETCEAMVGIVEVAQLDAVSSDAESLKCWLSAAEALRSRLLGAERAS